MFLDRLRQLVRYDLRHTWHTCSTTDDRSSATNAETFSQWAIAPLNDRAHLAWEPGRVLWLAQRLVIPAHLNGYPVHDCILRLALTWWAERAQIFVNGELVGEGDLFDCQTRIVLSSKTTPNQAIDLALRLVAPHHDPGALVQSLCLYERQGESSLDPGFFADEVSILQQFIRSSKNSEQKLAEIDRLLDTIPWDRVGDRPQFEQALTEIRQTLLSQTELISTFNIHLLGHAHLDLAWLWPIAETWDAAQRTFDSVLNLMADFPDLTFGHTTAALYSWIEQHRPDLFAAISNRVKSGQWEILASLWVEPELNLISGEAIARQVLYGQQYCLEKFGQLCPVAWLPDSFGFCWQIPQLFKQGGIDYFVTQKLRWNDTTEFPYEVFWWQSPDGTRIFSLMSSLIGQAIDPLKMASYTTDWNRKTGGNFCLWLPGVGDHGGGPTRDMLELRQQWQASPFFPDTKFTTAIAYLQELETSTTTPDSLPVWNDELYLEFHRGCYTTHADQKLWNRRLEGGLYEAELFASFAEAIDNLTYPKSELESAWKTLLFNQFHDILPGSSIPEVYEEVRPGWEKAEKVVSDIIKQSLKAIASHIDLPTPPQENARAIAVFNSLNWRRSPIVTLTLSPEEISSKIYDGDGREVRSQIIENRLVFEANKIPSIGYRLFWLCPAETVIVKSDISEGDDPKSPRLNRNRSNSSFPRKEECSEMFVSPPVNNAYILENDLFQIEIDATTGNIAQFWDKIEHREVLSHPGNQLQFFADSGQYWDAWNIDPDYEQHRLTDAVLTEIKWQSYGKLEQRVRVVRKFSQSTFIQDYVLEANSPVLKIETTVDWQERHVLVKAAFPLNLEADFATYEMPCGAIARSTQTQTDAERAKWEVPAIHWADLGDRHYGVSVLNNCKYGYDAKPNQLRLTLLRGATWPNPQADLGRHQFIYAVYPHRGDWKQANTVRRGYELNFPVRVIDIEDNFSKKDANQDYVLSASSTFLELSAKNIIVMALKRAQDDRHGWVLRCYETEGKATEVELRSDLDLKLGDRLDLLERPLKMAESPSTGVNFAVSPWQILTQAILRRFPPGNAPQPDSSL
ncbi:MAG: alpha-mannosidase [Cyanobacteria bacterium J007]|nr:MAG: alpha-mannosidase [Cyanobacteria bacterium J007]